MEQYIIANCTDVGVARKVNEDSMVTFDSPNGRVVAVCDGMGGQAAGDVASRLACSIIRDILENNTFGSPAEAITRAIMAANQGILHRASQDPTLAGMGATCVMVIIKDGIVYYGWVGDSRIYYVANHTIRQISKDQSYVQQLVDRGELTPEQAEHHPQKNEITNALGVMGMTPPEIGAPITPEPGSVILLCSDGLSGMVDNAHIERTVCNKELTLGDRARKLVRQANNNGGLDNITVQLIEFQSAPVAESFIDKCKKSSSTLFAVIAAAVIVLAVAAWFIWSNHNKPSESTTGTPTTEDHRTPPVNESPQVNKESPTKTNVQVTEPVKVTKPKATNPKDALKENNNKTTTNKVEKGDEQKHSEEGNSTTPKPSLSQDEIDDEKI